MAYILSFKKKISPRTNPHRYPIFKTKDNKFSFSPVSIKILNLFLSNYITEKNTKDKHFLITLTEWVYTFMSYVNWNLILM